MNHPRRATRTNIVWPRAFVDGPHVSAPDKPNSDWATGSPISSRSRRLRSTRCSTGFPRAKTILLGIAEASPYLFDLIAPMPRG
jgi:glutamate-ammonia-ligase adenylyltransferase